MSQGYRLIDLEIYRDRVKDTCWTPAKFAGVWERGTGAQAVELLLGHTAFYNTFLAKNDQGLRLIDIERDIGDDGYSKWSGVWEAGSGTGYLWRHFKEGSFMAKVAEMRNIGLRLVDVEFYMLRGEWKWAGIFSPGTYRDFPWQWEDDLTSFNTTLRNQWNTYKQQGNRIFDLEVRGYYGGRE